MICPDGGRHIVDLSSLLTHEIFEYLIHHIATLNNYFCFIIENKIVMTVKCGLIRHLEYSKLVGFQVSYSQSGE